MKPLFFLLTLMVVIPANSQTALIPSKKVQIKTAVQAAPKDYRKNATVLGYNKKGELVTLRKGNNGMTCLTDDPQKEGFSAACYSDKLEPFMARGRQLVKKGKSTAEKQKIRQQEIKDGKLSMPSEPAAVYVLSADKDDFNAQTGSLKNTYLRYVLYKPFMTAKKTGLPTKPSAPGSPWLMDAGTARSHVMISPARNN